MAGEWWKSRVVYPCRGLGMGVGSCLGMYRKRNRTAGRGRVDRWAPSLRDVMITASFTHHTYLVVSYSCLALVCVLLHFGSCQDLTYLFRTLHDIQRVRRQRCSTTLLRGGSSFVRRTTADEQPSGQALVALPVIFRARTVPGIGRSWRRHCSLGCFPMQ